MSGPSGSRPIRERPARAALGYPRTLRLTRRSQYRCVYDAGLRAPGSHLVLFVMQNDANVARLGVTATRKTGTAVARNRAKRLVREAFRKNAPRFTGWDLVVNVKRSTALRKAEQIEAELLKLFGRAMTRQARSGSGR